jgi:large conductance mechanosensitive channel
MIQVWKEFKEFAIKGNAIELAVGIVIGAGFTQIVNSLVNDILNPILSIFTGRVDFGGLKFFVFGQAVRYGAFLNASINFLIVAFAVFLLVKQINRFRKHSEPKEKKCPFCMTEIALAAKRCPACTSELNP